jgi:hypothetical protein
VSRADLPAPEGGGEVFYEAATVLAGVWNVGPRQHAYVPHPQGASRCLPRRPEVHEALTAARVTERSQPTLNDGETYIDLLADPSAYEDLDATPTSMARLRLFALQLEHLMGPGHGPNRRH